MIIGIIPARYASQRFPGKVLAKVDGKTMIQHVYERAMECDALSKVVVAVDHQLVMREVQSFGGECFMTSSDHRNGTERCAEVARQLDGSHYVNIQGDEPLIESEQIQTVCNLLDEGAQIATLKKRVTNEAEVMDPNVVKVVATEAGKALYFSRSPIPFNRTGVTVNRYQHIGLYGFGAEVLQQLVKLAPTDLEEAESLEQLRWLQSGYEIHVGLTEIASHGVDTPEDLQKVQSIVNERKDT